MASFQRPTPSDRRVRVSVRLGKGALAKTQRNGIETKQNAQQPTPTSWRLGALARDSSHTSTSLINSWAERPVDWKKGSRKDAKGWIQDKTETHNCLHLPLGAFAPWREIPPHTSTSLINSWTERPVDWKKGLSQRRKVAKEWNRNKTHNCLHLPLGAFAPWREIIPPVSAPLFVSSPDRPVDWKKGSRKDAKSQRIGTETRRKRTTAYTYLLAPLRLGERFLPHLNIAHRLVTRAPVRLEERALANTQSLKSSRQIKPTRAQVHGSIGKPAASVTRLKYAQLATWLTVCTTISALVAWSAAAASSSVEAIGDAPR